MAQDLESRREKRRLERYRVSQDLIGRLDELLRELWGPGAAVDDDWVSTQPHATAGARLIVSTSYGRWRVDDVTGTPIRSGSTLVDLVQHTLGLGSEREALDWAQRWLGDHGQPAGKGAKGGKGPRVQAIMPIPPDRLIDWAVEGEDRERFWTRAGVPRDHRFVARWEYRDAADNLLFYVCRFDRLDGTGKYYRKLAWFGKVDGYRLENSKSWIVPSPWPLWNLGELFRRAEDPVLLVEGEKAAEAAVKLLPSHVVSTWPGGANTIHHIDWTPLAGRSVTLWPDNDLVGVEAMQKVTGVLLRNLTADVATVEVQKLGLAKGWDLADELPSGIDPFTQVKKAHDLPDWVVELNTKFFIALEGARAVIFTEQLNPLTGLTDLLRMRAGDFCLLQDNKRVLGFDPKGNPAYIGRGTAWLDAPQRREYAGTVFKPFGDVPAGFFNLWRGFSCEKRAGVPWRTLSFIWNVICRRRKTEFRYVISWLARLVQRPDQPAMTAIVLTGEKGVGKGFFANLAGSLVRQHFAPVSSYEQLTNRFNGYLRNVVLMFLDEALYAGDKKHVGFLYSLITEPLLMFEHKGFDAVPDFNRLHLIIASNADWVVPASLDERRFCVLGVSSEHRLDRPYFKALEDALAEGERAKLLSFLLALDISEWNPLDVPKNEELAEQKIESLPPHVSFLLSRLRDGGWKAEESTHAMYESYLSHCQKIGIRHPKHSVSLGRAMAKLFKERYRTRVVRVGGQVERHAYLPPEEEARHLILGKLGLRPETGEEELEEVREQASNAGIKTPY